MASPFTVGATSYGFAALAGLTTMEDQRSANETIKLRMKQEADSSIYRLGMTQQEIKEIDRQLAMSLNQTEIQAMKDEAFAKAYTAESGLSGTSAKEVQAEASITKAKQQDTQVTQAKSQQRQLLSSMFQEKQKFEQRSELLLDEMQSRDQAGLSAFTSTMSGFQTGLGLFSQSSVDNFLDTTPKGKNNGTK